MVSKHLNICTTHFNSVGTAMMQSNQDLNEITITFHKGNYPPA